VRRTKILATIGPATDRVDRLVDLLEAGVDAFRLNFSHGNEREHRATLRHMHAAADRMGREAAIVADVPGPKVRLGEIANPPLRLVTGQPWALDLSSVPGDERRTGVELPTLGRAARRGDPVLVGDGSVSLTVERVGPRAIETRVVDGGLVSSHAGLFLPHAHLRVQVFGEEDRRDAEIALAEGVDFLALSFVRDARDLRQARRWLDGQAGGRTVGLIAKIERFEALAAIDGILGASDGIIVARGDLGIEVPLDRLALEQKRLVRSANAAGRFVIVATQMLLSMVQSPRPTRAEATDVANAVLDGADAVMLSEESAVGKYPIESVRWLARIAESTEPASDPRWIREARALRIPSEPEGSVPAAAVQLAESVGARAIVTPTHSGRTARLVAALRPTCPVIALSSDPSVRRRLALVAGVEAHAEPEHEELTGLADAAARLVRRLRVPGSGPVVLTAGYPVEGRPTNLITVVKVGPPPRPGRLTPGSAPRADRSAPRREPRRAAG
jgi:pyruvate kinase